MVYFKLFASLFIFFLGAEALSQVSNQDSSVVGHVETFPITMSGLGHGQRIVRVYLPPGYHSEDRSYPALYMFDAGNLFDRLTSAFGHEWQVDETLERLFEQQPELKTIVVGIDSPSSGHQRYEEYTGWDWVHPSLGFIHGKADLYGKLIVERLMPLINSRYRTKTGRDFTGVAGSSMGGYLSVYLGVIYQDIFSKIGAFSLVALDDPMRGFS